MVKYQVIPNPHTHALVNVETGEILLHQTYSNCLKEQKRLSTLGEKDVHTEHCCTRCGCKYGDEDCSVLLGKQKQTYSCDGRCVG